MSPDTENCFEHSTTVTRTGENRFEARIDRRWWIVEGPNGGYITALVLRAMEQAVADPERAPRSLTVHFTARPVEGPARIETCIERRGRSLTTVSARLIQEERLLCTAVAAFSLPRETFSFSQAQMPEVASPDDCPPLPPHIEIHHRYDYRWALGSQPFGGSEQAICGGWIRLTEPRIADAPLIAAYTDAFPPAVFSLLTSEDQINRGVPTIDLTIHFRKTLPLSGAKAGDFVLAAFRSRRAGEGFLEEDGEIWSRDGVLLAQSRQFALVM